jgi:hypothetical protein
MTPLPRASSGAPGRKLKVGTYDMPTELAVMKFQKEAVLEVDGRAGMNTLHRLDKVLLAVEKLPPRGLPSPL